MVRCKKTLLILILILIIVLQLDLDDKGTYSQRSASPHLTATFIDTMNSNHDDNMAMLLPYPSNEAV